MESNLSPLKQKKAQQGVGGLTAAILILVVGSVALVLGVVIIQEMRDASIVNSGSPTGNNTDAFGAINDTLAGLGTFGDFWEIIVLAIVIGVVLSILLAVMAFRGSRR